MLENDKVIDYTQLQKIEVQQGLSKFMTRVYGWMTAGLAITGFVAYYVASSPEIMSALFANKFVFYALIIGQLLLVGALVGLVRRISYTQAAGAFLVYSFLTGLTFSVLFLIYTQGSIATTFFVTAGTFAVMSVYGMITKADLTKLGNIMMMGLIGIIIASLVNFFLKSPMLYWIITFVGVGVFVGLIAYDTQKLKNYYLETFDGTSEESKKVSLMGALSLYLDFINLFLMLLRLLGDRR